MSGVDSLLGLDRAVRDGRVVRRGRRAAPLGRHRLHVGRDGRALGRRAVSTTDRFVETNGIRLHYLDHAGTGPTLVLAPGSDGERALLRRPHARGSRGCRPRARARHAWTRRERCACDRLRDGGSRPRRARAARCARARARRDGRPLVRRAADLLAGCQPSRASRAMRRDRCSRGDRPGVWSCRFSPRSTGSAVSTRPGTSTSRSFGRCRTSPTAAGTPTSSGTSAPTSSSMPDGTVQARCQPGAHRAGDRGRDRRRLAGAARHGSPADPAPACARELRAARLAAAPHPGGRRRDGREDGRLHGRRRGRQPHHVHVRRRERRC